MVIKNRPEYYWNKEQQIKTYFFIPKSIAKQEQFLRVQTGVMIYQRKCSRLSGQKGTGKKSEGQTGEEKLNRLHRS